MKAVANNRTALNIQVKICERAEKSKHWTQKRITTIMDLDSLSYAGLDISALLEMPDPDFMHDMVGIANHMDRSTYPAKLGDCFWPRFAPQH